MELKSAEREVQDLVRRYLRVRRYDHRLPPLDVDQQVDGLSASSRNEPPAVPAINDDNDSIGSSSPLASATEAMRCLEECRDRTEQLQERISKLERRLGDNDPVTGKPRYGEQTLARVVTVLRRYRHLQSALLQCFPIDLNAATDSTTSENAAVSSMRRDAQREDDEGRRSREEEIARREKEEKELEAAELRRIEEVKLREEEAAREEEQRIAEQARQAREARMALIQAREEAERLDRLWVQSIERGVDGVRKQLAVLVESTASDDDPATARKTATEALYTLFSQIVARPEEPNFRRIRRDHVKFSADIGRHKGGKEVLIAAGFELGSIDDVPCFLSKEPNIEKDMDGWAAWFDLLKGALEAIEEQLIALP
jgi:PUB domain